MVGSFVEDFTARGCRPAGSGGGGDSVPGLSAPPESRSCGPDPALLPAPVTESPVRTSVARSAGIECLRPRSGVGGRRRPRSSWHDGTWLGLQRQASILITETLRAPVLNMAWWGSPTPQWHRLATVAAPACGRCARAVWPASYSGRPHGHRRAGGGRCGRREGAARRTVRAVLPWRVRRSRPISGPGPGVRFALWPAGCGPVGGGDFLCTARCVLPQ